MVEKRAGQLSLADALVSGGQGSSAHLDRLDALVQWHRFDGVLGGLRSVGVGRPGYAVSVLFKAVILQSLYGLSDPQTETALADRLSFRRFVGLGLSEAVPDHSTLCRFRLALIEQDLLGRLFNELDRQLEQAGVVIKKGTMLDATVIATQASARPRGDSAATDPQAGFGKRTGKAGSTFGYKAHVGVDQGSGLVRAVVATAANVNDTTPADALIRGDERVVWADSAYHTHARAAALKARGIKPRLMRRANKHHPVLPPRLKRYNRLISRHRAAVETTFATWKRRMGLVAIRYVGLVKATAQITLVAMAFNMRRWAAISTA